MENLNYMERQKRAVTVAKLYQKHLEQNKNHFHPGRQPPSPPAGRLLHRGERIKEVRVFPKALTLPFGRAFTHRRRMKTAAANEGTALAISGDYNGKAKGTNSGTLRNRVPTREAMRL